MTLNDVFHLAMKREVQEPLPLIGVGLDIGAGNAIIPEVERLTLPDWQWPRDKIPVDDSSIDHIHAYHFLEHLKGEDAIDFLIEAQRVLKLGGIFQFCVPYYNSSIMCHDLTHKSFWNEDTFKTLFNNDYYDPMSTRRHKWRLRVHFQVIIGIVERNLALIGQLVKE